MELTKTKIENKNTRNVTFNTIKEILKTNITIMHVFVNDVPKTHINLQHFLY